MQIYINNLILYYIAYKKIYNHVILYPIEYNFLRITYSYTK